MTVRWYDKLNVLFEPCHCQQTYCHFLLELVLSPCHLKGSSNFPQNLKTIYNFRQNLFC